MDLGNPTGRLQQWQELHDWATCYRKEHQLTTNDLLRSCGLRESLFKRRLLYRGGRASEPSKCDGTDGKELFEALCRLKTSADAGAVHMRVSESATRDEEVERCNDILSEFSYAHVGVIDCYADRERLDGKLYIDLSLTDAADVHSLCSDIQATLSVHGIGLVNFRIDLFYP
jgi:hypothetical protein